MKNILFVLFLFLVHSSLHSAERINYSCRVSFNINYEKIVEYSNQSISCGNLEKYRKGLFVSFSQEDYTYIIENIETAEKNLRSLSLDLKAGNFNEEHLAIAISTIGKSIAAIGLSSCIPTAGSGCIGATIGFSLSLYGQFTATKSYIEKAEYLDMLSKKLRLAKIDLQKHKKELPKHYEKATRSFNEICEIVKNKCTVN